MTKEDIQALGLPVGEQIRLRESIERLHEHGYYEIPRQTGHMLPQGHNEKR